MAIELGTQFKGLQDAILVLSDLKFLEDLSVRYHTTKWIHKWMGLKG